MIETHWSKLFFVFFFLFFTSSVFAQLIVPPDLKEIYSVGEVVDLSTSVWNDSNQEKTIKIMQELVFMDSGGMLMPFTGEMVLEPDEIIESENLGFTVTEDTYEGKYRYRISLFEDTELIQELVFDFNVIEAKKWPEEITLPEEDEAPETEYVKQCNMDGECNEWETIENCPTDCTKEDIEKREKTGKEKALFEGMDLNQIIMTILVIVVIAGAIGFWYFSKQKKGKTK